ncbi:hypothetical protein [Alkalihalobacterium bogoriense]|uniref:hypothetical protein n=1 Tax=Alkalihalobacterium bogoriense TaxID=246272 RepID=UPI00047BAF42|nr:hypothetical protein [Alkalihalobacterium bogoriense]
MLNQPQFVFSFTIPYYSSVDGESIELFVSEKTYEFYLFAQQHYPLTVIHGDLHPHGPSYGEATDVLFDKEKALLIIGSKDIKEYSNEIIDISVAYHLQRILHFEKATFVYYTYSEQTPGNIQQFIDDIQHILESIPIYKFLIKKGYRIAEREQQILQDGLKSKHLLAHWKSIHPLENEKTEFLFSKLVFTNYVCNDVFIMYKKELNPIYPRLFSEFDQFQKQIRKYNFSTKSGQQKALQRIFRYLKYESYLTPITINDIPKWQLNNAQMK